MNATIAPAPVRKSLTVRCAPEKAFQVFTDGFDRWWPRSHHIGAAEEVTFIMEPRAGGRWYERGADGSESDWGEVLAWEPPARVLLAWRLNAQWAYDPKAHSEVEVRFTSAGDGLTRVDFEHRCLEVLGAGADQIREQIDSPEGWGAILAEFQKTAEAA
jgi:uncharacterized protein YndB with AHSA1/START domain